MSMSTIKALATNYDFFFLLSNNKQNRLLRFLVYLGISFALLQYLLGVDRRQEATNSSVVPTTAKRKNGNEGNSTNNNNYYNSTDHSSTVGVRGGGDELRRGAVAVMTEKNESSITPTPLAAASLSIVQDGGGTQDLRICRLLPTDLEVGQDLAIPSETMNNSALPMIHYQCAGQPYKDFVDQLWTAVVDLKQNQISSLVGSNPNNDMNITAATTNTAVKQRATKNTAATVLSSSRYHPQWGERPTPVPLLPPPGANNTAARLPKKKSSRAILFMGHSHTRQVFEQLVCQYQDQVVSSRQLMNDPTINGSKNVVWEVTFQNNVVLYGVFNCAFVYSHKWMDILERMVIQRPVRQLDAIVLGPLHNFDGTEGTTFRKRTLEYQDSHPEQGVDFQHIRAPTLAKIAAVYPGTLIWVSAFAKKWEKGHNQMNGLIRNLHKQGRKNVRSINSRRHISFLLKGKECSCDTDDINKVGTCYMDAKHQQYSNGHRCIGTMGGEPDLAAWDIVEALYDLLDSN